VIRGLKPLAALRLDKTVIRGLKPLAALRLNKGQGIRGGKATAWIGDQVRLRL
jgi:hypothetical protein